MMNTRSRTRIRAAEVASRSAPSEDLMGIEFVEDYKNNQFRRLKGREVQSTKWDCPIS